MGSQMTKGGRGRGTGGMCSICGFQALGVLSGCIGSCMHASFQVSRDFCLGAGMGGHVYGGQMRSVRVTKPEPIFTNEPHSAHHRKLRRAQS